MDELSVVLFSSRQTIFPLVNWPKISIYGSERPPLCFFPHRWHRGCRPDCEGPVQGRRGSSRAPTHRDGRRNRRPPFPVKKHHLLAARTIDALEFAAISCRRRTFIALACSRVKDQNRLPRRVSKKSPFEVVSLVSSDTFCYSFCNDHFIVWSLALENKAYFRGSSCS